MIYLSHFPYMKDDVWFVIIDHLSGALRDRFPTNALEFLNNSNLLTHQKLLENKKVEPNDFNNLCFSCNLDLI